MKRIISVLLTLAVVLSFSLSSAVAADESSAFVSSIEQKVVPTIEEESTAIVDSEGNDVGTDLSDLEIVNTAVSGDSTHDAAEFSEEDQTKLAEATNKLQTSYEEASKAEKVSDVIPVDDTKLEENEEYVVSDMFDVTFVGSDADKVDEVLENGGSVTLTFKIGTVTLGTALYVATQCGSDWTVLADAQVSVNYAAGTVTVTFYEFCPIAIIQVAEIVESAETETEAGTEAGETTEGGGSAPQTGDKIPYYAFAVVVFAGLTGTLIVVLGKKKDNSDK